MQLKGKRVLVFGTGVSGIGSAQLLDKAGACVVMYDSNRKLTVQDVQDKLSLASQAEVIIGELPEEVICGIDLAVVSPGVPMDIEPVRRILAAGKQIWGEIELAYQCSKGDVLAITGTNGKTTTTTLLGEIMRYHLACGTAPENDQVFVVGNIGTPYTSAAPETTERTVCVAEISSFQLETVERFHPAVSAITNITPDHLDRHHTMEEYIRVKEKITQNQTADDTCVLNYEDPVLRKFGEALGTKVLFFSSKHVLKNGLYLEGNDLILCENGERRRLLSMQEVKLPGIHNYENIMTAVGMALAYHVPMQEILHVVRRFTVVEHRIEYVAEVNGVIFYNDSKGTNPDAAIKAVLAMDRPTVLIGGGYDKGASYTEWIRSFDGRVKCLVLTGQTKEKIREEALRCGFDRIEMTDTFEEAFAVSVSKAQPGDAVLLSPACASWGMFPNYEVRGRVFKELVGRLAVSC